MNVDIEPAGALATATLAAHEIEANTASNAGDTSGHGTCANCGTHLTGAFCHTCGQPAHLHRSLLHLSEELLHGIFHFDTKGWRTIPVLVAKPGVLTRRYIDGHRMRYVSPLALFLFMMFFMFFVFSLTSDHSTVSNTSNPAAKAETRKDLQQEVVNAKAEVAKAQAALNAAQNDKEKQLGLQNELDSAKKLQAGMEFALTTFDAGGGAQESINGAENKKNGVHIDTGNPSLDAVIEHAIKNPELIFYKMKNTAYKFAFLLVPLSLPFLWLLFCRRKDVVMYDHAVFSLYSLSFMALLFSLVAVLNKLGLAVITTTLIFVVPPVHMFMQLRDTYQISVKAALWRTAVLSVLAAFLLLVYGIFVAAMSLH